MPGEKTVTARKRHRCDSAAGVRLHFINPGERYRRSVMFPGDINSSGRPWVFRTCETCAASTGKPLPDQAAAVSQ